jgi:hypothetical protein
MLAMHKVLSKGTIQNEVISNSSVAKRGIKTKNYPKNKRKNKMKKAQ